MGVLTIDIPIAFVTYHPEKSFYCDLDRFLGHGQKVYIFCNCAESYTSITNLYGEGSPNIKFLYMGKNVGLSKAYNSLLDLIRGDGFSYYYLFDQDTQISDYFFSVKDTIPSSIDLRRIVLAQLCSGHAKNQEPIALSNPMFVINSGSLVNASLIESLGGYPKNYFVDGVDYYVCLIAKVMDFKVGYVSGYFGLDHTVGQGDVPLTMLNKSFLVRFYGWSRIKDVSKSHVKLIILAFYHFEIRYALKLTQFLTVFYLRNIFGLFLSK